MNNWYLRLSSSFLIAWLQVKSRYARSTLGPFWITINMLVLISGLSFVFWSLFGIPVKKVLPWITIGIVTWNYINTYLDEACTIFTTDKLLNVKISPIKNILINIFKNFIIFLHNAVIIVPVLFLTDIQISWSIFFLIFTLIFFFLNSISLGIILGFLCARFRDFHLVVKNFLYLMFLMTPIFWTPDILKGNRMLLADLNILYQFIQMVRDPLLGKIPNLYSIVYVSCFSIIIIFISAIVYRKYKNEVIFWI